MSDTLDTLATLRDSPFRLGAETCHPVDYRAERSIRGCRGEQIGRKPVTVFEGVIDRGEDLGR